MNWFTDADEATREAAFASGDAAFDYCIEHGHIWESQGEIKAEPGIHSWRCSRCRYGTGGPVDPPEFPEPLR